MLKQQNLRQSERQTKSTNAKNRGKFSQKLFFDIESDNSESQQNIDMHSSMSKLQRLKSIKMDSNSKIGPSMMNIQRKQDNYMMQSQPKSKTVRLKFQQKKCRKKFQIFDNEQQIIQIDTNLKVETAVPPLKNIDQFNEIINPEVKIQKKRKFFQNQVQEIKIVKQEPKKEMNSESQQIPQNNQGRNKLIFQINSQESENQQQQSNLEAVNQSDATTCGEQKDFDIINVAPATKKLSSQLSQKFGQFQDPNNIRIFLSTPIPDGVYFEFEVHKFKNFMKTQYLFWLQHNDSMSLYATAVSDKIYLDKNVFTISIKPTKRYSHYSQKQLFIGQFVSNFKRQTYTLYDHQNYTKPNQTNRVLCTVATVPNYINPKMKCQCLYIPKVVNSKSSTIHNTSLTKNLKKLHKLEQFTNNVSKFTTHTVPHKSIEKMREEFKVVTNTTRNAFIKDQKHNLRFFILKMQQSRFKIRAGPGLTPTQIFSYAIVHLE